jgi:hypothetical protein
MDRAAETAPLESIAGVDVVDRMKGVGRAHGAVLSG